MWNEQDGKQSKFQPAAPADAAVRKPGDAAVPHLGRSVVIRGEISASEDLTLDGQIEGRIDLPDHVLTVGPNATLVADVTVRAATVFGSVVGSITAREKLDVRLSGSVEGTVSCGRLAVQEGATINAKIETKGERRTPAASPAPMASVA
jgi:cytoskeletal protein CcmA (bactofilin family)